MMLPLVFDDPIFCVVHKPVGMSVHNDPEKDVCSLLARQCNTSIFPVHRLDQETSGLLICAKTREVVSALQSALQQGTKEYLAIVRGVVHVEEGAWSVSISDKAEGRRNPRGQASYRKAASTSFARLQHNEYLSLLSIVLHTGRQHQIRKHCALARHEILGDTRYGTPSYQQKIADMYQYNGLTLHAHRIHMMWKGEVRLFSCLPHHWECFGLPIPESAR